MATLKNTTVAGTGAITLPVGTTAQRLGTPQAGDMRFNDSFDTVEYYDGSIWRYQPDIVRSGLVLHLDAGEPDSYPGTGTTWSDLSGNSNDGTIQSTTNVTYSSSFGGILHFDGNTTGSYITISSPNLSSSNYTVMAASRYTVTGGRIVSANANNWLLGHWGGGSERHFAEGWITDFTGGASDTNWRIYAGTGDVSGDQYSFFVNGELFVGPSAAGSAGPNGFQLGRQHDNTTEFAQGDIGFLLAYNRILTASEIYQNFQALRGRYGI